MWQCWRWSRSSRWSRSPTACPAGAKDPGCERGASSVAAGGADSNGSMGEHLGARPLVVAPGASGRLLLGTAARGRGRGSWQRSVRSRWRSSGHAEREDLVCGGARILSWEGPVLAASIKTDLVSATGHWRRSCGTVWCFDPAGDSGLPASPWSPLPAARTWPGARRLASDLTEVGRAGDALADGDFWYALAAKLLAPSSSRRPPVDGHGRRAALGGHQEVARWRCCSSGQATSGVPGGPGVVGQRGAPALVGLRHGRVGSGRLRRARALGTPGAGHRCGPTPRGQQHAVPVRAGA